MAERKTDDVALSDKLAKAATSEGKVQRIIYDGGPRAVRGFGLRVTVAGARSFILTYWNAEGRQRRTTIGTYPQPWSVEAARKKAGQLKRQIRDGHDPLKERTATRTAPTMADLCDRYIEDHLPRKRPSSQAEDKSMIARALKPKLGTRKVAAVTHAEIDKLHRDLKATPYRANRVLALVSKMFSLAIRWGWRTDNPAKGVERYPEVKRTRNLAPDELQRLTTALDAYPDRRAAQEAERRGGKVKPETVATARRAAETACNIVRLLLLTGCRRGEALGATWDQLDLERGVWIKPGATTKQKTTHIAPLGEAAVALLRRIRDEAPKGEDGEPIRPLVFSIGNGPISELNDEWAALRTAAKLPGVRLHDLRHSFASLLVSSGASLPMIGALLGHTNPNTTARYAHLFDDPLRKLADEVGHVVTGTKPADVVPIRKDAKQ
jgi:integrase